MKKLTLLIPLGAMVLFSCRKLPNTEELTAVPLVQTTKASTANFGNYKTYFMPDTIGLKTDNPKDSFWVGADALQLINAAKANMAKAGYTFVDRKAHPDLGLTLYAIKNLNIGVIYPGYWGGYYWGGCYWGYCGYPPYYGYGYPVYYSITTATMILDLADIKNAPTEGKLDVLWTSVISGGLGYTNNDLQLGVDAINQAYIQSPYIHTP